MVRILVTGATGFVGKHLSAHLCTSGGAEVVCLVRKGSRPEDIFFLRGLGAELYVGDLRDGRSIGGLADNVDTVVHLAAKVRGSPTEKKEYFENNVTGTRNLVDECKRAEVARFFHMSTVGVFGPAVSATEDTPTSPQTPYDESKLLAERIVAASGLDYLTIRLGMVFGPYHDELKVAFRIARSGFFPLFGNAETLIQPLYVGDFVTIFGGLLHSDIRNQTLIVAGERELPLREFVRMMGGDRRVRPLALPLPLCRSLRWASDTCSLLLGKEMPLGSRLYNFFTTHRTFDITRLRGAVKVRFTPLERAVEETASWALR